MPCLQCHILMISLSPIHLCNPPISARILASNTVSVWIKLEGYPEKKFYLLKSVLASYLEHQRRRL